MLQAEHGNADVRVADLQNGRIQAIDFMAERNANGKARLPIEDIERAFAGLDSGNFEAASPQFDKRFKCVGYAGPRHTIFRTQRRLCDRALRRACRYTAEK